MGQREADRKAALKWAETRAQELREELDGLHRFFPELRGQLRKTRVGDTSLKERRKRRPPTAAERRRISEGMRKLWARRKAEEAKVAKRAS